jgi:predicted permease
MNWINRIFARRGIYGEFSEEIREHLEEKIEELVAGGMSRADATAAARREFGNVTLLEECGREVWQWPRLENFVMDVRYGLRQLRKNPGFTAVAVLTLALGIGANTAIFTVLNSVLLTNLPVQDPKQLVFLTNSDEQGMETGFADGVRDLLTYPEFQDLAARNQVFTGMLAVASESSELEVSVADGGQNQASGGEGAKATVSLASGSYFAVLGVQAIAGRTFTADVDKLRDANPVAVVSYGFWRGRLGGDPSVIGRKIRIRETSYEIIGVTPAQFHGETVGVAPDIWVPLSMQSEIYPGRDYLSLETKPFHKTEWLQVIGRLKAGVNLSQANASVNVVFQQMLQSQVGQMSDSDQKKFLNQRVAVTNGSRGASTLRGDFEKPLQILMGMVGLLLLIACANVANLLLARATARQREIAVRVAMGAGASRLFRQVLTESVLLAGIGGIVGLLLANWADNGLLWMVSGGGPSIPLDIHPDARVLGFTLGVSVLTGILFGLAPALRATNVDLNTVLKGTSRSVTGGAGRGGHAPMGKILVVGQIALSLLLLVVAGLFVHSFQKLAEVQLGYDRDHLVQFEVNPVSYGYRGPAITQVYKDLLARIEAIPGVRGASLSDNGILYGTDSNSPVAIEGAKPATGQEPDCHWDHVGPNFFSTTGIPILLGREIGVGDGGNAQRVGVINQTMERYYFGDENPIGRRITVMTTIGHWDFVVVGVAADSKHRSVREKPQRRFYVPFFNPIGEPRSAVMAVRTAGDPSAVTAEIRDAVRQTAANLPSVEMYNINHLVDDSLTTDRTITQLSGVFGALAVVLACIGIYGIMAYSVAGRTNEIGIRMALGAQRGHVLWMVLRETAILVFVGVAIGLPAVVAAGKLIASLLFGVTPADPLALSGAAMLMFLVAAISGYIPARRAMRVDPMVALRYE